MSKKKEKRTGALAFLAGADTQESGSKFTPHGRRPGSGHPPARDRSVPAAAVSALSSSRRTIDVPLIRPMENPNEKVETEKMQVPSSEELAKAWGMHQQSLHELKEKKKAKPAGRDGAPSASSGPITRETLIMDVVSNYPEVLPILLDVGLHCIGCTLSAYDTMQTGCELHGFDQETIDQLIKAMNGVIERKKKEGAGGGEKGRAAEKTKTGKKQRRST
jgi:hybrid cluster-associated redox disulfide protein